MVLAPRGDSSFFVKDHHGVDYSSVKTPHRGGRLARNRVVQRQLAEVLVVLAASSGRQAHERIDEIDRYLHGRDFEVSRVFVKSVDPVEALWDSDS